MRDSRRDDFLSALRSDVVQEIVQAYGAPESAAMQLASKIIGAMQHRFQGETVYFPAPRKDIDAVLRDFDGRNYKEVCRKHHISRSTLYRHLQRHRSAGSSSEE